MSECVLLAHLGIFVLGFGTFKDIDKCQEQGYKYNFIEPFGFACVNTEWEKYEKIKDKIIWIKERE